MSFLLQKSIKTSYKRKEMDVAPTIVLTDESDEGASNPAPPTRKVERWKCDICCVETFPTIEECIAHEEICKVNHKSQKEEPKQQLHPFFELSKRKQPPPPEAPKPSKKAKANKNTKDQRIIVIDDMSTSDTAKKVAPVSNTNDDKDLQELAAALGVTPESLLAEQKALERQADLRKQQKTSQPLEVRNSLSHWKAFDSANTSVKRRKAALDTQPIKDTSNNELNALAAVLGVKPASLLAEQQAVELKTHHRQQAAEKHKSSQDDPPSSKSPAIIHDTMKRRKGAAALFPSPNHVTSSENNDILLQEAPVKDWLTSDLLQNMKNRWISSFSQSNGNEKDFNYPPIPLQMGDNIQWEPKTEIVDQKLFELLSRNLQVLPRGIQSPELWVDRFRMRHLPDDLCGNKSQLLELQSFLKEWKDVRQKCLKHMASKHVKKKTPKAKKYKDDDDFMDSDAEEDFGLPSLCLVSGPVGCGKSDLVRALVESNDCRLVEISTVEKRGAAALKRAIGEATQSLSSSDLMRKSKQNCIFGINTVDDTVEEEDNGSSLTAILLDEVDILFENNGDGGFWQALLDLSRKAKSPIFLTANAIDSPSFYCEHVQMKRPLPEECTLRLRRIIRESGSFQFVSDVEADQDEFLKELVRLCGRDMRKVTHVLQAYSNSTVSHSLEFSNDGITSTVPKSFSSNKRGSIEQPSVNYVHPCRVDSEQYNLLEITGIGFLSLIGTPSELDIKRGVPVTVYVGDRKCPVARILNDSTIMAVCQPYPPDGRGRKGSISYEPIQICSTRRTGITSTILGYGFPLIFPDGSTVLTEQAPINIQLHFNAKSSTRSVPLANQSERCGEQSDEEFEFEDEDQNSKSADVVCEHIPLDSERVSQIINDGIDAWLTRHPEGPEFNSHTTKKMGASSDINELRQLCVDTELASDAVFLEDVGMNGTPYLAGPTLGFGYNLTEAYPLCSNETSKCPSESILFQTGWKDDCGFYGSPDALMTLPLTQTDRRLLVRAEKFERGLALPEHVGKQDDEEDSEKGMPHTVHVNSEDSFLPNPAPLSLMSLPNDLRNARTMKDNTYASLGAREVLFDKAKPMRANVMQTLHSTLFANEAWQPLLFFSVLHRTLNPLLPESLQIDTRFDLDYFPFLRCLAVFDRAAERAFKKGISVEDSSSKRRANTRRAARKGFSHFWEKIVTRDLLRKNEENEGRDNRPTARELTNMLADLAMYSISFMQEES